MRFASALAILGFSGLVGCNSDAPKEDAATADAATAQATATAEPVAGAEDVAAAAGERVKALEHTKVTRPRETVRTDLPKTKAVVGN